MHANNYGAYDDDNGTVIYELNDFDESVIGDYQYDVWRMAVSLVLVARQNDDLNTSEQEDMVDAFSESYLDVIAIVHGNDDELHMSYTTQNAYGLLDNFLKDVVQNGNRKKMLDKWAPITGTTRLFDLSNEKLGTVDNATRDTITNEMPSYGTTLSGWLDYYPDYFAIKDIARRLLAGIGSLGTARYYVLIEGKTSGNDDDRILDIKRHAVAYNAMTRHTDDHLGWILLTDGIYSVRERSPYKETFDTTILTSDTRFTKLAEQWGAILAMAHARADKDADANLVPYSLDKQVYEATDGKHSEFPALVRDITFNYADQVEADWQTFVTNYSNACSQ